ncbi:MAG: hypothetical protein ACYCYE_09515 [Clostridia bacterium]
MKYNDCKNFKVQEERIKKDGKENASGTCVINNSTCGPEGECATGLIDKTGAI